MGGSDRRELGKIIGLAAFLEEHCEAVEADLARYYREDLRELFRDGGRLSWRRLEVLLAQLPLESATQTLRLAAMTDEDYAALAEREHTHGAWSHTDLLLAGVLDAVERLSYVQRALKGDKTAVAPQPIPRPGIRTRDARAGATAASRAYLDALRARHNQTEGG